MNSRTSSLNPNAASYIPLSKKVVDSNRGTLGEAANISESSIPFAQGHDGRKAWIGSNAHETKDFPIFSGNFTLQGHQAPGSSSQHPATSTDHKLIPDEVHEVDLEYLQMIFPGLSYESLNDVYIANKGDVEASVDMLNDLEYNPYELPETLDIGDASETMPTALKLKNVAGGVDASSSTHYPPSLN